MNNLRPLSPHIQIYRPEMTSTLSITHRLTGVALSVGLLTIIYTLYCLAAGAEYYLQLQSFFRHWVGKTLFLGWSFSFIYHLINGVRHLIWDIGYGYEKKTMRASGWGVILLSLAITSKLWMILCY